MIKTLHIQNFQSHVDTTLEFSDNVTAIVGLNNYGKSAILRSVYKTVRNEPEGTTFIHDDEDGCTITLETDQGVVQRTVKKDQSSDANQYVVNGLEFNKFGRSGIPDEVLAVCGFSLPQMFGDVEYDLNFQIQLEDLFLITGRSLESIRGKVFGRITGVDCVQRAIQLVASEEKSIGLDLKSLDARLSEIDGKLEQYNSLDDLLSEAQVASGLVVKLNQIETDLEGLCSVEESLKLCVTRAKLSREQLAMFLLDVDLEALSELNTVIEIYDSLLVIETRISELNAITVIDVTGSGVLGETHTQITELEDLYDLIGGVAGKIQLVENSLQIGDEELIVLQENIFNEKEILGVCPVCEKPF